MQYNFKHPFLKTSCPRSAHSLSFFSQGQIFSNYLAVFLTFLLVYLTIASICSCISCTSLNNIHWKILWFISLLCHGSCKWAAFRWWIPQFSVLNFSGNFTSFLIERWLPASTKFPPKHITTTCCCWWQIMEAIEGSHIHFSRALELLWSLPSESNTFLITDNYRNGLIGQENGWYQWWQGKRKGLIHSPAYSWYKAACDIIWSLIQELLQCHAGGVTHAVQPFKKNNLKWSME